MKQFFGLHPSRADAEVVAISEKLAECLLIFRQTIGPRIAAKNFLFFFEVMFFPSQAETAVSPEAGVGEVLGLGEELEQSRKAGMLGNHRFARDQQMHNREDSGLLVEGDFDFAEIFEEPFKSRIAVAKCG